MTAFCSLQCSKAEWFFVSKKEHRVFIKFWKMRQSTFCVCCGCCPRCLTPLSVTNCHAVWWSRIHEKIVVLLRKKQYFLFFFRKGERNNIWSIINGRQHGDLEIPPNLFFSVLYRKRGEWLHPCADASLLLQEFRSQKEQEANLGFGSPQTKQIHVLPEPSKAGWTFDL